MSKVFSQKRNINSLLCVFAHNNPHNETTICIIILNATNFSGSVFCLFGTIQLIFSFMQFFLRKPSACHFNQKSSPTGAVDSVMFEIENNRISSHYDLPIKSFHSTNETFLLNIGINRSPPPRLCPERVEMKK